MSLRLWSCIALASTALLAACGGSGSSPGACGAPRGQVALAYPAPNSTGIPDNFNAVIFASTNGLSSSYQALVLPNGSSSGRSLLTVAPFTPPLPSPAATPPFANPIYQSSGSGGLILPAATLVGVYLNDLNSNCTASFIGSFTTR